MWVLLRGSLFSHLSIGLTQQIFIVPLQRYLSPVWCNVAQKTRSPFGSSGACASKKRWDSSISDLCPACNPVANAAMWLQSLKALQRTSRAWWERGVLLCIYTILTPSLKCLAAGRLKTLDWMHVFWPNMDASQVENRRSAETLPLAPSSCRFQHLLLSIDDQPLPTLQDKSNADNCIIITHNFS